MELDELGKRENYYALALAVLRPKEISVENALSLITTGREKTQGRWDRKPKEDED